VGVPAANNRGGAPLGLIAGALATVVVAGMLATVVVTTFSRFDYNADVMYLPALYHDLASGTPVRNWRLPMAPGFLSEMPLMFGILWLTGENIPLSFVIYSVASVLLLAAATVYLVGGLISSWWRNGFIVLAAMFLWAVILLAGGDGTFFLLFLLMPSFHSGVLVVGTFLLACSVRLLRNPCPKIVTIVWILIAGGGIASDPFFLVQFFVPILFCMFVLRRSATYPEGFPLGRTVLLGVSAAIVAKAVQAVTREIFSLGSEAVGPMVVQVTKVSPLLRETYKAFEPLIKGNPATCVLVVSGFMLAAVLSAWQYRAIHRPAPQQEPHAAVGFRFPMLFCMLFFLVSGAASLMFPLLNLPFRLNNASTIRYVQPLYVFPLIILSMCVSVLASRGGKAMRAVTMTTLSLGCVVGAVMRGGNLLPKRLFAEVPGFVQDFDRLHEAAGVTNGLGSYWLAKPTCLLSDRGVHIDAVWLPWGIFSDVSNLQWYLARRTDRPRLRRYEFIVPYSKFPAAAVVARFGPPAAVYGEAVVRTKPDPAIYEGPALQALVYDRKSDVAFHNFLYMPVIAETDAEPPSTVKSPPNLQKFKFDGLPTDYPGCSTIPAGGSLEVVFDPPAEGDVLEISADYNDEYEAQVRYLDGRSETLKLPVVPGVGLQRRFLLLSRGLPAAINRGGDPSLQGMPKVQGLTIRPISGDGAYSVGHVFVYQDSW